MANVSKAVIGVSSSAAAGIVAVAISVAVVGASGVGLPGVPGASLAAFVRGVIGTGVVTPGLPGVFASVGGASAGGVAGAPVSGVAGVVDGAVSTGAVGIVAALGSARECSTCQFYFPIADVVGFGICRRYPPIGPLGPEVKFDWWCGDYRLVPI